MKVKLPLKYKFISLQIGLLLSIFGLFLFGVVSYLNSFQERRVNSDFLDIFRITSRGIDTYLKNRQAFSKLVFANITSQKMMNSNKDIVLPKVFFNENKDFLNGFIYWVGADDYRVIQELEGPFSKINKSKQRTISKADLENIEIKRSVFKIIVDKYSPPILRIGYFRKKLRLLVVLDYDLSLGLSEIMGNSIFKTVLTKNDGEIVFSNPASVMLDHNILKTTNDKHLDVKNYRSQKGKDYLYTGVKLVDYKIKLFLYVAKDRVFEHVKVVIAKGFSFAGIVLLIVNLIFILFSGRIARPLSELIKAIQAIKNKDYSKRVNTNSNDEIGILAKVFNSMSEDIQQYIQKIEEYNQKLEATVEERTRELKKSNDFIFATINSLNDGLFVVNEKLECLPTYTNSCLDVFGQEPRNRNLREMLNIGESSSFDKWIKLIFSNSFPFESAVFLGPQEIKFEGTEASDKIKLVSLSYFPIRNEDEEVINLVVVGKDTTKEYYAEKNYEQEKNKVLIISNLIKRKKSISNFLELGDAIIKDFETAREDINGYKFKLHSLKGVASVFGAVLLAESIHKLEDAISERPDFNVEDEFLLMEKEINYFIELTKEIDVGQDEAHLKGVDTQWSRDFYQKLSNEANMKEFYENCICSPANELVADYLPTLEDLAMDLGKPCPTVNITNGDLRIDLLKYDDLKTSLVHVFRNMMDHGLETESDRIEKGKEPAGKIEIVFEKTDLNQFVMQIRDDGNGIDRQKVLSKIKELNPEKDYDHLSEAEIYQLIFLPDFSTKDEVSTISGRGVGLNSVKDEVDKIGGVVEVESELNKGCNFIFKFNLDI